MAIVRWGDPFEEIFGLRPVNMSNILPAIDVYEDKDNVIVEASMPGMEVKDVEISVENDVLTIQGQNESQSEVDEKNYYRKEVRAGSFYRQVVLPHSVQGDKAKADYEKGILKITLPKREETKPKSIKIAVNK